MARLIPLIPPPKVELSSTGWEVLVTEAGRAETGLHATVQLWNGTMHTCQHLALTAPDARLACATELATLTGLELEVVAQALLTLTAGVEGVLRQTAEQAQDRGTSQATRLVALALDAGVELFHTPDTQAYATIAVDDHRETWLLKVKGFRRWLARQYYEAEGKTPSAQAVQDALGVLEGKALFDGPDMPVFTRLAGQHDAIYMDLADEQWRAIEITAQGWRVVSDPPVRFRRARGMLPLPMPCAGGTLAMLRHFANIRSDSDWMLLTAWLVAAMRSTGPYPVLVLHGEQGAAKSTLVRVLRALIDPNEAPLRSEPREVRDLMISAANAWCLTFDNLSHLPPWLSDALCRLATGGGFATRELYSDTEETIFTAQRPVILNGIEELVTRADLLDRSLLLYLPTIPPAERRAEEQFWEAFAQARSHLLGALCDALSAALRTLPTVTLTAMPRMADFARWACAAAPACAWSLATSDGLLTGAQAFLHAYAGNREVAHDVTIEASLVAQAVQALVVAESLWQGTASELLTALSKDAYVSEDQRRTKAWPKTARTLANTLRRLAPTLRAVHVDVEFSRDTSKTRARCIRLAATARESYAW